MFTGLVRELGRLRRIERRGEAARLVVEAPRCAPALARGDSLAVNGICLTVTRRRGDLVEMDAVAETRRATTLDRWRPGDRLHLEPALRASDPLGGHFVLGHVDGVGAVAAQAKQPGAWLLTIAVPEELARGLVPKGSVAVDGVSLTLAEGPRDGRFAVSLIPETLAATRLGELAVGAAVNIELDVLVKAARAAAPDGRRAAGTAADAAPAGPAAGAATPAAPLTLASILARGFTRGPAGGRAR